MKQNLSKTFVARHLLLSKAEKGENPFGKYLPDPEAWKTYPRTIGKQKSTKKRVGRSSTAKKSETSDTYMVYNVETGQLEPL